MGYANVTMSNDTNQCPHIGFFLYRYYPGFLFFRACRNILLPATLPSPSHTQAASSLSLIGGRCLMLRIGRLPYTPLKMLPNDRYLK